MLVMGSGHFFKFIYFERERERENERGADSEGERIPSRLPTVSAKPNAGLDPMNHEIIT